MAAHEPKEKSKLEIFGKLPGWIFKHKQWKRLSGSEKAVLGVLVWRANNENHRTWISLKNLSDESGVSLKSISRITSTLHDMAIIKKWRRFNHNNYQILFFPPPYLEQGGINWDTKADKAPKSSDTYRKDSKTGRFTSEGQGNGDLRKIRIKPSEETGNTF